MNKIKQRNIVIAFYISILNKKSKIQCISNTTLYFIKFNNAVTGIYLSHKVLNSPIFAKYFLEKKHILCTFRCIIVEKYSCLILLANFVYINCSKSLNPREMLSPYCFLVPPFHAITQPPFFWIIILVPQKGN